MKTIIVSFFILCLGGVNADAQTDLIYHYSVLDAMRNGVYIGDETISSLAQKGNFGLGTFNNLDGEMIALDGVFYRIDSDGTVVKTQAERKVPFASVTFFKASANLSLNQINSTDDLQKAIVEKLPSTNQPYAIRIHTTFSEIAVGGANKMADSDTTGIAELMKVRPIYKKQNISGTLVGFYNPAYVSGVDLSPFHLHFISDDKRYAGHLISGKLFSSALTVMIDDKDGYQIVLPKNTKRFYERWSDKKTSSSSY